MVSSGERVLIFDGFLTMFLGLFGNGSTGINGFTALQSIAFPTLAPLPAASGGHTCAFWDIGCQALSVANATAYLGWAVVNLPVILLFFADLFITFSDTVLSTIFSPSFSSNGVPVIGFFFIMLQIIVVFEVLRDLRGVGGLAGSTL